MSVCEYFDREIVSAEQRTGRVRRMILCRAICDGIGEVRVEDACANCGKHATRPDNPFISARREAALLSRVHDAHIPEGKPIGDWPGYEISIRDAVSKIRDKKKLRAVLEKSVLRGHRKAEDAAEIAVHAGL